MIPLKTITKRQSTLTLALGTLGAAALILGNRLVDSGPHILVVYALVIGAATLLIRLERIGSYRQRFAVGLGTFMISSLGLYVSIAFAPNSASLSALGHAWRLAALLFIGIAVSLVTARIAEVPEPEQVVPG